MQITTALNSKDTMSRAAKKSIPDLAVFDSVDFEGILFGFVFNDFLFEVFLLICSFFTIS